MINISNKRECFFDNYLIDEKKTTAETRVHHPVKREPVMIYDAPWEGNNSHFQTMLFDGEKYMMYYYAATKQRFEGFCVATSKDCIKWERPNCGMLLMTRSLQGYSPRRLRDIRQRQGKKSL